jgi:hypothetical protein
VPLLPLKLVYQALKRKGIGGVVQVTLFRFDLLSDVELRLLRALAPRQDQVNKGAGAQALAEEGPSG